MKRVEFLDPCPTDKAIHEQWRSCVTDRVATVKAVCYSSDAPPRAGSPPSASCRVTAGGCLLDDVSLSDVRSAERPPPAASPMMMSISRARCGNNDTSNIHTEQKLKMKQIPKPIPNETDAEIDTGTKMYSETEASTGTDIDIALESTNLWYQLHMFLTLTETPTQSPAPT